MKRFIKNTWTGCLMLVIMLASCTDDEWEVEQGSLPFHTEEGRMVEVELPFAMVKSMETTVVTRASDGQAKVEDDALSGIHLAIFRDSETNDPTKDELIFWKLYARKGSSVEGGSGFWEDTNNENEAVNDGILRFYAPTGKVYIYLLANTIGTMFDFFKDENGNYTTDATKIKIPHRKAFFDVVQPKWKGTLVPTDGYLPMTAIVNNKTGKCFIGIPKGSTPETADKGGIWYLPDDTEDEGKNYIEITTKDTPESSFLLKRMVSKVTFKINNGTSLKKGTINFTPRNYTFRHVAQYVPTPPNTYRHGKPDEGDNDPSEEYWPDNMKEIPVIDSNTHIFSTQTPNSFTVYLPENMRGHSSAREDGKFTYAMRDKVVKEEGGNATEEEEDIPGGTNIDHTADHKEHYKFQYAPKGSTYVEITGHYERKDGDKILESGDTKYIIHLGDFSDGENLSKGDGFNNFNLVRDRQYIFNVTINGITDIETEVDSGEKATEPNPGVEGIIFQEGAQLRLDAHYETVEMRFMKGAMQVVNPTNPSAGATDKVPGIYIYTETPFGDVFGTYVFPKEGESTGKFYEQGKAEGKKELEKIEPYFQWVTLRQQTNAHELMPYADKNGKVQAVSVFQALDDFWKRAENQSNTYEEYYTCFVDEYYYTTNPKTGDAVQIKEFVNKPDRTFSLASDVKYSADGKSGIASAVYVLKQRSIATFYDIETQVEGIKCIYGLETVDELEGSDPIMNEYGIGDTESGAPTSTDIGAGWDNTKKEADLSNNHINWSINGYLLNDKGEAYLEKPSKRLIDMKGRYACLTRNRDFNGNGKIDENELRWYTPSLNQVLGIWVGEPGLPSAEAALYTQDTQLLDPNYNVAEDNYGITSRAQYPIFTSSGKNGRVVWGEEGCSFGPGRHAYKAGGRVRAVRTLSSGTANADDYKRTVNPFYTYNNTDRTITLHLNSIALREVPTERELEVHHERDVFINRPYRKFQVAKHPYGKVVDCSHYEIWSGWKNYQYYQIQRSSDDASTDNNNSKTVERTILQYYKEDGEKAGSWRLPNQRELALMTMAISNFPAFDRDDSEIPSGCDIWDFIVLEEQSIGHGSPDRSEKKIQSLHCRTAFSNSSIYPPSGNATHYRSYGYSYHIENGIITLGRQEEDNSNAGYLGVRDVP